MQFYQLTHDSFGNGGKSYPWAYGYGLLSSGMPFLSPTMLKRKEDAHKLDPIAEGIELSSKGVKWPDVLGCGGGPPMEFYSERVIEALEKNGVVPYRVTPMPLGSIVEGKQGKRIQKTTQPDYFVVEAQPGIEVDWQAMGIPTDKVNSPILKPLPKPWPPQTWKVVLSSWNGSHLFSRKGFDESDLTRLFCTEKVKELAEKEGWTNITFKPLETT